VPGYSRTEERPGPAQAAIDARAGPAQQNRVTSAWKIALG